MKKLAILLIVCGCLLQTACKKELNVESVQEIRSGKPAAPAPNPVEWEYIETIAGNDIAHGIASAADGSYFVAGNLNSREKGYVMKYTVNNTRVWANPVLIDFNPADVDDIRSVVATDDGGCIIWGMTVNPVLTPQGGKNTDFLLAKISATGTVTYMNPASAPQSESGIKLIKTVDGFVLTGYSNNSIVLMKLDASGNLVGRKDYSLPASQPESAFAYDIIEEENDFIITGRVVNNGIFWGRIAKDFNTETFKIYQSQLPEGVGFSIAARHDGSGYLIVGRNACDAFLLSVDNNGNYQWDKKFGGSGCLDLLKRILPWGTGYITVGTSDSRNGDIVNSKGGSDLWLMTLDANGNKIKSNNLGGKNDDRGEDMITGPNNTVRLAGAYGQRDGGDIWNVQARPD